MTDNLARQSPQVNWRPYRMKRETGMHGLRHHYASVTLADGVRLDLAEQYLDAGPELGI